MSPSLPTVPQCGIPTASPDGQMRGIFFASFLFDFPYAHYLHLLSQVQSGLYCGALSSDLSGPAGSVTRPPQETAY